MFGKIWSRSKLVKCSTFLFGFSRGWVKKYNVMSIMLNVYSKFLYFFYLLTDREILPLLWTKVLSFNIVNIQEEVIPKPYCRFKSNRCSWLYDIQHSNQWHFVTVTIV